MSWFFLRYGSRLERHNCKKKTKNTLPPTLARDPFQKDIPYRTTLQKTIFLTFLSILSRSPQTFPLIAALLPPSRPSWRSLSSSWPLLSKLRCYLYVPFTWRGIKGIKGIGYFIPSALIKKNPRALAFLQDNVIHGYTCTRRWMDCMALKRHKHRGSVFSKPYSKHCGWFIHVCVAVWKQLYLGSEKNGSYIFPTASSKKNPLER